MARPLRSDAASVRSVSTDPYEDYRSQPYEFFKDADPEDFLYPYARKGCFIQLHEGHDSDQVPTSPEPDKVQKTSPESAKVSKSDLEALEKKSDLFAIDKKEDEVGKEAEPQHKVIAKFVLDPTKPRPKKTRWNGVCGFVGGYIDPYSDAEPVRFETLVEIDVI